MPVDEYGNVAEVMIGGSTFVSRNNPSGPIEVGINFISEIVRKRAHTIKVSSGTEEALKEVLEWCKDVNPMYHKVIEETYTTPVQREAFLNDMLKQFRVWAPPTLDTFAPTEEDRLNVLRNFSMWSEKYGAYPTHITRLIPQADGTLKKFVSDDKFVIGKKYILHLSKLPTQTAPGFASTNHMGIPIKSSQESKFSPVSLSPYKFGEDEIRVMSMDSSVKEVGRLMALYANSPTGVKQVIRTILEAEHPTRIARTPISNGELARTNTVLRAFHSSTTALGVETRNTLVTSQMQIPDEIRRIIADSEIFVPPGEDDDESHLPKPVATRQKPRKTAPTTAEVEAIEGEMILPESDLGVADVTPVEISTEIDIETDIQGMYGELGGNYSSDDDD